MLNTKLKRSLSKEWILKLVSQKDIMEKYLGFTVDRRKKTYTNPMRVDNTPGCSFFVTKAGTLQFVDWAQDKRYDCFSVVMERFYCTFWEALKIIDQDFGLGLYANRDLNAWRNELLGTKLKSSNSDLRYKKVELNFTYTVQEFNKEHLSYWKQGYIDEHILTIFNVFDTVSVSLDGKSYMRGTKGDPIYTYAHSSNRVKFYRPLNKTGKKWRGNVSKDDIQGLDQLPESGDLLIITSSLKDVMSLYSMGFYAIAPQSESNIPEKVYSDLSKKWKHIVVLFDNDKPGIKAAKRFSKKFSVPWFVLTLDKDVFDSVKNYGYDRTKKDIEKSLVQCYKNIGSRVD